jgi:signal transduction histidine kinase
MLTSSYTHRTKAEIVRLITGAASTRRMRTACGVRRIPPMGKMGITTCRVSSVSCVVQPREHAPSGTSLERERLEQRLRQVAKMETLGRLAGGIAHDLNNVLTSVFGYGEMLIEKAPADSPLKRYAQNVIIAATRGRELVEQILTYSRAERGKRVPVDIAKVVAETLELLQGSLPAGIRVEASAPATPLVVIGNATQLHQVVMNLCSNAIQAMRARGILRVTLETAELSTEQALSDGTLGRGDYLRLIVEGSGCGMDEVTLARLFEPFFTTKEFGQGTGFGLSLVYAIIVESGGAIDVKSAPEQGSTFTIYLPRWEVARDMAAPGQPRRDRSGSLPERASSPLERVRDTFSHGKLEHD